MAKAVLDAMAEGISLNDDNEIRSRMLAARDSV